MQMLDFSENDFDRTFCTHGSTGDGVYLEAEPPWGYTVTAHIETIFLPLLSIASTTWRNNSSKEVLTLGAEVNTWDCFTATLSKEFHIFIYSFIYF